MHHSRLGSTGVSAPFVGATRTRNTVIAAVDLVLTPEERARLEAQYRPHAVIA